jgi:cytochrome c oxidase subunit 2
MWWSSVASAASNFTPPVGTAIAAQVDQIYLFLLVASLISFIIVMGGFMYFVVKYRRRTANDKTAYITHNHTLEFLWSFIPFVIFIFSFAWGWFVYHQMRNMPENALEVHVMAKKWDFRFLYKNGKEVTSGVDVNGHRQPATMVVPVNQPVKLIQASEKINPTGTDPKDRAVLHGFFIPAFRIKQDIVPGRYTAQWFQAEKLGEYWVFCTQYCGAGHSAMNARIKVVSQADFDKWLSADAATGGSLADQGRALYGAKACASCHSVDGSRIVGPSFKGLYGRMESTDKGMVKADEDYLRESILQSNAKIVTGYPAGVMPLFAGTLTDAEVNALIEFIKSVK